MDKTETTPKPETKTERPSMAMAAQVTLPGVSEEELLPRVKKVLAESDASPDWASLGASMSGLTSTVSITAKGTTKVRDKLSQIELDRTNYIPQLVWNTGCAKDILTPFASQRDAEGDRPRPLGAAAVAGRHDRRCAGFSSMAATQYQHAS